MAHRSHALVAPLFAATLAAASSAHAEAPQRAVEQAPWSRRVPRARRPRPLATPTDRALGRLALDGVVGVAVGVGFAAPLSLGGVAVGFLARGPRGISEGAWLGALPGFFFGAPLGVTLVGEAYHRRGNYGWALVGGLGGGLLLGGLGLAAFGGNEGLANATALAFGGVLVGSVAAYEIAHAARPRRRHAAPAVQIAPTLAWGCCGGTLGVAGTF